MRSMPPIQAYAPRQPLVLIPGLLCDALLWANQIEALGASADCWVADHSRSNTVAAIAQDVLQNCPFERFSLAGLSMGGYIALEIQRLAPQRVQRLALLDTNARPDSPEQTERRNAFIELAERGRFVGITDALLPLLLHRSLQNHPGLVAIIKSMARNTGRENFVRQEQAIISRRDSRPWLGAIDCPTLVLCGAQDLLTPPALHEEIAAAIPGARLHVVSDCGHLSALERPEEVTAALEHWLEQEHRPA
jgi:pimeloyl-ACP methyl ester carboxylesterase